MSNSFDNQLRIEDIEAQIKEIVDRVQALAKFVGVDVEETDEPNA
jgi:hypothetical protein